MDAHAIPPALLRELPQDPADVLAVAQQIAAFAFSSKAAQGDAEVGQVRQLLTLRQTEMRALERRATDMEAELAHARAESRRAVSECERLNSEKAQLVDTVKNLSKEVAKLDAFKRNVLKTLNDESVETVDHTYSPAYAEPLPSAVKRFQHGGAGVSLPPHSAQRDAAPADGVPDGKSFFRTARSRLSPDTFAAFLESIKSLNAHKRTRAQTLDDAAILFENNHDLYVAFEQLLQAHLA